MGFGPRATSGLVTMLAFATILIGSATLAVQPTPAHADSMLGPSFRLTGELVEKRDGWIFVRVASVEPFAPSITPPEPGDLVEIRVGFGARFLKRGTTYVIVVFIYDGYWHSRTGTITYADGTPIDTSLMRRTEFRVALGVTAIGIVGLVSYAVFRHRHPRRQEWRL